MQLKKEKV